MSDRMNNGKGKPRPSAGDDPALSRRLRDLDRKLDEHRSAAPAETEERPKQGTALAMRLSADFIAGVVLGAALGWGFDRLFGTSPWGLAGFLLLGFAAGILAVMRSAGVMNAGPSGPDDIGDRI